MRPSSEITFARRTALFLLCAVAALSGCYSGGKYPVSGRVVDTAGQPIDGLEGSEIQFSNDAGSSVGEIKKDGSFSLFTETAGDGVPPGDYQVLIARRYLDPERAAPQVIQSKYERFEASGLTAKVEPKRNQFEFKVERFKRGP
jgi:hypothetical protein